MVHAPRTLQHTAYDRQHAGVTNRTREMQRATRACRKRSERICGRIGEPKHEGTALARPAARTVYRHHALAHQAARVGAPPGAPCCNPVQLGHVASCSRTSGAQCRRHLSRPFRLSCHAGLRLRTVLQSTLRRGSASWSSKEDQERKHGAALLCCGLRGGALWLRRRSKARSWC